MSKVEGLSGKVLAALPAALGNDEIFETLLLDSNVRIKPIISTGQVSAEGFW